MSLEYLEDAVRKVLVLQQKVSGIREIQNAQSEVRTIKSNAEYELSRTSWFDFKRKKEIKLVISLAEESMAKLNELLHKKLDNDGG
jgi:hypothetical protein